MHSCRYLSCETLESTLHKQKFCRTFREPVWRTKRSTEKSRFRPSDGCRGPKGRGSRCEAARAAIRFGGQVREDVLKCTIAPGFGRKQRGRAGSFSPLFPPTLRPFPSPTQPAQPAHPRQQERKHRDTPGVTSLFLNKHPYLVVIISQTAATVLINVQPMRSDTPDRKGTGVPALET